MKPQLLQEFEQNKGRTGEGIGNVGTSSGGGNLQAEFAQQSAGMESLAGENGVKHGVEVGSDVQSRRSSAESQVNNASNTVNSSGNSAKADYNSLQKEHEQGNKNFNEAKSSENERQKLYKHDSFTDYEAKIEDIKGEIGKKSKDLM